jgi:phosphatidylserine decarboxylase
MFVLIQRLLPKHLLSRIVGWLAATDNVVIKTAFITIICFFFPVDLSEEEREEKQAYKTFNDFFTRQLKPGARRIEGRISSPADGKVAALGPITGNTIIQSKNHNYTVNALLAEETDEFEGGSFITIYLAPHNYHRVHVPRTSELHSARYIPGELFSVNLNTAENLPDLFARNERLACRFRTGDGPMAEVLVGAMLVAGIKPVWLPQAYKPKLEIATEMKRIFQQGEELGQFEMGSTVILLFSKPMEFSVKEGDLVQMGQSLTV